jgi:uncharacterized metal-binding protein YceD (DUF177 family)
MSSERFCLRIDGCVGEERTHFEEILPPSFVDLPEGDECVVCSPITVCGSVYRTEDFLFFEAKVDTAIQMPCSTCTELFTYPIHIDSWKIQEQASLIKEGFWDLTEQLREAIVVEFPFIAKCGNEVCKNFDTIKPYLKTAEMEDDALRTHRPFQSLLCDFEIDVKSGPQC